MKKQTWAEKHDWRGWSDVPILLTTLIGLAAWCFLMAVLAGWRPV